MGPGCRAAASTRFLSGRQITVDDILSHGAVEEKRFLLNQADLPSQKRHRQIRTSYPSTNTAPLRTS